MNHNGLHFGNRELARREKIRSLVDLYEQQFERGESESAEEVVQDYESRSIPGRIWMSAIDPERKIQYKVAKRFLTDKSEQSSPSE